MTTATDVAIDHGAMKFADSGMREIAEGAGGDAARAAVSDDEASAAWDSMQDKFEELVPPTTIDFTRSLLC